MGRKLVKDIPLYICGGDGKETGLGYSIIYLWWRWEGNWLRISHYISVVGMGRKLVKDYIFVVGMGRKLVWDIPLYICGGDGKETG